MNKALIYAAILTLLASPSHAVLQDWSTDISLNDDKTSEWTVSFVYNETQAKHDYFILASIQDYEVFANGRRADCRMQTELGTSIICSSVNAKNITYRLVTGPVVVDILQNFRLFTHRLPATQQTEKFTVTVSLPFGSVLAEESRLSGAGLQPFEPDYGVQGSDGRRIFVRWALDKPTIGDTLNVAVVYEQLGTAQISMFAVIIVAMIAAFFFAVTYFFRRSSVREMLPVLNQSERHVVEILLREKGSVDQRSIVKETDFSKAKVSRIIQDLANRGVLEKVSRGRKNLIRLKKAVRHEKMQSAETTKKQEEK